MKIFIDSGNTDEIREANDMGLVDGVTTNPTLAAKSGKPFKALTAKGIKTNVTLCFNSAQALLAAKAGATYISPFVGRIDDTGWEGMQLIRDIRLIYDNYGYETQILTASARSPMHFIEAAKIGSDVITAPFSVLKQLLKHPLTDSGLKQFLADWEKAKQ